MGAGCGVVKRVAWGQQKAEWMGRAGGGGVRGVVLRDRGRAGPGREGRGERVA